MIEIPKHCPSCNYPLIIENEQLFCRNAACEAQNLKKLEHFAKTLKIKGLGPKTLEKLELENPHDLYNLPVFFFTDKLGDKVGNKLFNEIQLSKQSSFATVLAAFSIPLIGNTASQKVAKVVNSFEGINAAVCKEAGLGEKATASLLSWLEKQEYKDLPFSFKLVSTSTSSTQKLSISVCITGKLSDYSNRADAQEYLESLGFTCTSTVTKSTNALVDEEGRPSSKRAKAEELGIEIVTINQLIERYII